MDIDALVKAVVAQEWEVKKARAAESLARDKVQKASSDLATAQLALETYLSERRKYHTDRISAN